MKTIIYYFTGTGNNLAVAKGLQKELGETTIRPIEVLLKDKRNASGYDRVGICSPSYYSHVPPFVTNCLTGVIFEKKQIIFTIIGCGGNRGHAAEDIRNAVETNGASIQYEFMIVYPGSHILGYNAYPMFIQRKLLKKSEKKIKKIAQVIRTGEQRILFGKSVFFTKNTDKQVMDIINQYGEIPKEYTISKECIKCGTCISVCPVGNITMSDKGIEFGDACQRCMACIQWCPKRAINKKGITDKRNRYHHPLIKASDIADQSAR